MGHCIGARVNGRLVRWNASWKNEVVEVFTFRYAERRAVADCAVVSPRAKDEDPPVVRRERREGGVGDR